LQSYEAIYLWADTVSAAINKHGWDGRLDYVKIGLFNEPGLHLIGQLKQLQVDQYASIAGSFADQLAACNR